MGILRVFRSPLEYFSVCLATNLIWFIGFIYYFRVVFIFDM